MSDLDDHACPSCGGAGGGPFGPAGSAWDDEAYVCPRCEGTGLARNETSIRGPGVAKADGVERADEARREAAAAK